MNVPINDIVVLIILTLVHLIAIFFTLKVGQIFNSKSWGLIVFAFVLLLIRRLFSFLDLFGVVDYSGFTLSMIDKVYLPLVVWILIAVGMLRIYYKIRSSIEIESKIRRVSKKRR